MRCSILVVMSLVCVSQVAGADLVPIRGGASSTYVTDFTKTVFNTCDYDLDGDGIPNSGLVLTIDGTHEGNVSHLGKTHGTSTVIYDTCTGTYSMELDLASANGDAIHLTGGGYDLLPPGPDGGISSFARFDIDGGTGRFENAAGNVALEGIRYDDQATGISVDTFDLSGAISTVGSVRSVSPVPEPASLSLLGIGAFLVGGLARRRGA